MAKNTFVESSGNVFEDVGFDKIEAKSLQMRSQLMDTLIRYIQYEELTQKEAAKKLHVSQPRISNLLHGKIDLFSAGMLLEMMERAGCPIYKTIQADANRFLEKYPPPDDHYPLLSYAPSRLTKTSTRPRKKAPAAY